VRLRRIENEYEGRVRVRRRFFPLELLRGEGPPRDLLEHEWWVAAIQEADAPFHPYPHDDWPTTTLPAFDGMWAVAQQNEALADDFDLRVRRAFFAEGRNIGRSEVIRAIAQEAGVDLARFDRDVSSSAARAAVIEESRVGREQYHVRGTPTLMLGDGTRLRLPIAYPRIENQRIVAIAPLACYGRGCDDAMRALFDRALTAPSPRDGGES
jgi:predicted DsbA family dithiol-disulfide isomerase